MNEAALHSLCGLALAAALAATRTGEIVCGRGTCVADIRGEVMCSTVPRGAATLDRYGDAACSEGCEPASAALCVRPRR